MEWTAGKVKALRKHIGMNQTEFGEYLGYSGSGAQSRISEIEREEGGVSGPVSRLLDFVAEKHDFEREQ